MRRTLTLLAQECKAQGLHRLYCRSLQTAPLKEQTCDQHVEDSLKLAGLVQLFRSRGHLSAQLDPLRREAYGPWLDQIHAVHRGHEDIPKLLQAADAHATASDKASALAECLALSPSAAARRQVDLPEAWPGGAVGGQKAWDVLDLTQHLRQSYCGSLAVEMDHLTRVQQAWLVKHIEAPHELSPPARLALLNHLVETDTFEHFLAQKFPGNKRFGIEGCEALLPGMRAMAHVCALHGAQHLLVGMPHRGRLNVLCTLLQKPPGALFAQMNNAQSQFHVGDVKYHLGQGADLSFSSEVVQTSLHVSVLPNPSHLEAVGPVVLGMVRAEQERHGAAGKQAAVGLLVHGDAAFAGLGLVAETLQLANVPGFTTGGTLHLIINNQTGFTTSPGEGRSSVHPSDMAKAIGAPIWHANADDPEAVIRACTMAAQWRAAFHQDAVVDVVGYRRYGHNELEDPKATLPVSYHLIEKHPSVLQLYSRKLQDAGLVSSQDVDTLQARTIAEFEEGFKLFQEGAYTETLQQYIVGSWQGEALQAVSKAQQEPTELPLRTLQWVGNSICQLPSDLCLHPSVMQLMLDRRKMVESAASRVDFAMAEALAFGALALHRHAGPEGLLAQAPSAAEVEDAQAGLNEGAYAIRLTGQDSERGTFNQRHAVLHDQHTGARYLPLDHLQPGAQEPVEIWNSPLSEGAVLGFEYGFSLRARGRALVLWEAQFGDFANNAQAIIDQFLSAGEERWGQQSGLVLMLPHGYEGQGPDHSSARPERFLSLINDDPAHLPGLSPTQRRQIRTTFEALSKEHGGRLRKEQAVALLKEAALNGNGNSNGTGSDNGGGNAYDSGTCVATEGAEQLWAEMGLAEDAFITEEAWTGLMVQYMRRNAERHANMAVVAPTTPAQLFHVLRRQVNRPFSKPLVLLTPKALHFHRHATSALHDLGPRTFFNRIIDDGKASDNTRHLSHHPRTGAAFTVPAPEVRRVILCTGGVYYLLSRARRARRVADVVLVRIEQLAPFPHDLVVKAVEQYRAAEVVWCQEEPKNMGCWRYIKPRYETAMHELVAAGSVPRELRYVGRAAAASPATASMAIHQAETRYLIDTALSDTLIPSGAEDLVSVQPAARVRPRQL